jgi:glycosyltransferase involved in cell wall biosynthesis
MFASDELHRVSVIIPAYNRSSLLRLTVESVLAQTYPNVEIIVVDDGSTDDTAEVMKSYVEQGRIIYIRQANQGHSGARNTGIRSSSGEYLAFLDHDDLFMPRKLERQVQVLDTRPEIGLVHCGYYHVDEDGNLLEKVWGLPEGMVLKEPVCGNPLWSGAPLMRRQCLDQVGFFDPALWCEDTDMWLRIAQAGYQFACVQEPLGKHRVLLDSEMSNVDRLEHGIIATLDKVFGDPDLPADVVAVKHRAYGGQHFLLSCMYCAAGRWADAQRNLVKSLVLRPQSPGHAEDFVRELGYNALSWRVKDPAKLVTDYFDHLPTEAAKLSCYRTRLLGRVYIGLGLRNFGVGNIPEGKRMIHEAVTAYPKVLEQPDDFAEMLLHYAARLPVDSPLAYAEAILQNLPASAQSLVHVRSRALSDVGVASAFQAYFAGRWRQVVLQLVSAARHNPACLGNRGVASILLRSLPGFVSGRSGRADPTVL